MFFSYHSYSFLVVMQVSFSSPLVVASQWCVVRRRQGPPTQKIVTLFCVERGYIFGGNEMDPFVKRAAPAFYYRCS
jgi:hypothetical protein